MSFGKSYDFKEGIKSIDTEHYTIMKVRTANNNNEQIIIGSDYDGIVLGVDFSGNVLWTSKTGNGTMNHDIWCQDVTGDNIDEIFAANANGHLYCFDIHGNKLWEYRPYSGANLTPMYSVCVVKDKSHTPYVVCGDYTCNIYYLSNEGKLIKKIHSSTYSKIKGWGADKPKNGYGVADFLKPIPQADGSDLLFVCIMNNHMQSGGEFDILKPLSSKLIMSIPKALSDPIGEVRVEDLEGDGIYEILFGSSTLNSNKVGCLKFNQNYTSANININVLDRRKTGKVSYRVNQPFIIPNKSKDEYSVLSSNQILTYKIGDKPELIDHLSGIYTYNDIYNAKNGLILLASSQDGGSCIHIIDTKNNKWKSAFENLRPIGKIKRMRDYATKVRKELKNFKKPKYQRDPVKVVGFEGTNLPIYKTLGKSKSLELLASPWNHGYNQEPSWRSPLYDGNIFLNTRDKRNKYVKTQEQIENMFIPYFKNASGIATWAGHGNDPLYYDLKALKNIADYGYAHNKKKTIYVYPEMNRYGKDFDFVMNHQIFPLMDHLSKMDGKVAFRAKDIFWQGQIYTSTWKKIISGQYASTAIPLLEETTNKTQDLSLIDRIGLWAAGSVDGWGVRCSRDDPSFDRSRQFSSQKLSNHFLRKIIYSVACGARYLHNSYPDTENPEFKYHTSLALELIAKEALYVPKTNEIVSFSPVHLSIVNPQERYMNEGSKDKWTALFNKDFEDNNPMVFSHMNGSWPGASLTPWDFSRYANGVVDRRQNIIAPYPNGQVLITPVQNGVYADKDAPRGKLVDHLNPIYKGITQEYITDGVNYISSDGKHIYKADEYYSKVKKSIEEASKVLPVLVSGDKVGWVVAQMSPKHLRLTLVDASWLAPDDRVVTVKFNNIKAIKVQDVLDKTEYTVKDNQTTIDVPCGMFRFIDITLKDSLLKK